MKDQLKIRVLALISIISMLLGALGVPTQRIMAAPQEAPLAAIDCQNGPFPNEIVEENCQPGSPPSEWEVSGAGDLSIQGFATDISVNKGGTISFKIDTPADAYHIDIYRLGYYGGDGARLVDTISPSASLPQNQPDCLFTAIDPNATDPNNPTSSDKWNLTDCGNWGVSASWAVPSTAVALNPSSAAA